MNEKNDIKCFCPLFDYLPFCFYEAIGVRWLGISMIICFATGLYI